MKNVWITLYEINLVSCFSLDKIPLCTSITIYIDHSSFLWFKENKNVYHMDASLGPLIMLMVFILSF